MTILDISDIKLSYLLILVMVFVYTHVCVCGWLYNCTLYYSSNMPALLTSAPSPPTGHEAPIFPAPIKLVGI